MGAVSSGSRSKCTTSPPSDLCLFVWTKMTKCPHPPRLVELTKWENFPGYGFNLHAEKTRQGQYIGKIDGGSPAEAAGLREGDRIVEVNGANVGMENHKQVVSRIRASGEACVLLVADKDSDTWHREQSSVIRSSLSYIIVSSSRRRDYEEEEEEEEELDLRLRKLSIEEEEDDDDDEESSIESSRGEESTVGSSIQLNRQESTTESESSVRSANSFSPGTDQGLQLNMSARQMRDRLIQQRRRDPRTEPEKVDWWQKHRIVQSL